ncbi:MAG: carbohydrate ABC transporter permease [Clostridia bacterium]|nr:carbohydrate ABC transporter permease [Clostridia bacterium]
MNTIETRKRRKSTNVLVYAAIAVLLIINLFPVYWMFIGSLKARSEVYTNPPVFFPKKLQWSNFTSALNRGGARGIRNSLIVAGTGAVLSVVLGSLAAYSIARYKTGGDGLSFWILSIRMAPPIAGIIPVFMIMRYARLLDKHAALILAYFLFNLPFAVWLTKGFFEDIPADIEGAALVDGFNRLQVFWRVALPLAVPALIVTGLFCFIFSWNEFLFSLVLTRSKAVTLPVIISGMVGGHEIMWGEISALSVLTSLPVTILAMLLQKYLVRGLTFGAMRG